MLENTDISRRHFLKKTMSAGTLGAAMAMLPTLANAHAIEMPRDISDFKISFRNQHTGESFSSVYKANGRYNPDAFHEINHVMRDFRTGDIFPIDPRVIDILFMVRYNAGAEHIPYEILSGYRSPKTNAMLGRAGTGVASNSLHMTGQAADLRLPGYKTRYIRNLAVKLKAGGVGFYPKSNFIHVDTGRPRNW